MFWTHYKWSKLNISLTRPLLGVRSGCVHCNTAVLQECGANISKRRCRERKKTTTATTKKKVLLGDSLRAAPRSRLTAAAPPACGHLNSTGEFTAVRLSHSLTASLCKECRVSTSAPSGSRKHGLVIIPTWGADSLAPPLSASSTAKKRRRWECERKGSPECRRSLGACWGWLGSR